jgi:hypothetical protein
LTIQLVGADAAPHDSDVFSVLCGRFVRLAKPGRFDEPTFENKRTRLFLYQRAAGEWVIGSRRGGTSYRAACMGELLGESSWSCFGGGADHHEWAVLTLSCAEADEGSEAVGGASIAPALVVSCRYANIAGHYTRRAAEASGPTNVAVGQFYNAEDDKILWHNAKKEKGCWMISDPSGVPTGGEGKFACFVASAGGVGADVSPEEADWSAQGVSMFVVSAAERRLRHAEHVRGANGSQSARALPAMHSCTLLTDDSARTPHCIHSTLLTGRGVCSRTNSCTVCGCRRVRAAWRHASRTRALQPS